MDKLDELMSRPPATTSLITGEADPLDQAMDTYIGSKRSQLNATLNLSVDTNPVEYARKKRIANLLGAPLEAVDALPQDAERAAKIREIQDNTKDAPKLRELYTDQDFARLANTDSGILAGVERAFKALTTEGWGKSTIQDELGELNYRALLGTISPTEQVRRKELKSAMMKLDVQAKDDDSAINYVLRTTGYTAGQVVSSFREGGKGGLIGAVTGAGTAFLVGQTGPQVALPEEVITVPGATLLGARAGFIAGATVYNYRMESGFAFDEFSDMKDQNGQPLPRDVVIGAATAVGLINAGLETVGDLALAKLFPGMDKLLTTNPKEAVKRMLAKPTTRAALASAGKKWVTAASAEAVTEALQELSVIFGREATQAISGQPFAPDKLSDDVERIGRAGMDAFVGSLGVGAAPSGYRAYREVREAKQMQQNQEFITALGDSTQASELAKNMPEKFQEFVAKVKEGGPVDNIYISSNQWQTFFQSQGVDPAEVATQAGATNYVEAIAAGTDIVIPVENYAAKLAGSQFHAGLAPDIRLRQGDMTAREYEVYMANREAEQQALQERIDAMIADQKMEPGVGQAVEQIIADTEQQLIATGAQPSTARTQASLMRGIAVLSERETIAMADREGRQATQEEVYNNAMGLWERYGLTVSRPLPEVLTKDTRSDIGIDPILDRLRAGDFPDRRKIYGKSLVDFLREKGGLKPVGELTDVDKGRAPFERNLIQETGMTLDEAASLAVEAGYLQGQTMEGVTESDLVAAIEAELAGGPVFSDYQVNPELYAIEQQLEGMQEYLSALGIDLKAVLDNAEVRRLIDEASAANPELGEQIQRFMQALSRKSARQYPANKTVEFEQFKTGQPVTFDYAHNTQSATALFGLPKPGDRFQRDLEPSGRYIVQVPDANKVDTSGSMIAGTITFNNPLVIDATNWKQELSDFYGATGRNLSQALINSGYDGVVTVEPKNNKRPAYTSEILDLTTFQPDKALYQSQAVEDRNLIIQHNLTAENLLHAVRMGGIPVPSLAVTKKDTPLTGFGEITLLGSVDMADPKGYANTRVFGGDIYSPRYPSITIDLDRKALANLNEALAPYRAEGDREIYGSEISKPEDLMQRNEFKAYVVAVSGKQGALELSFQEQQTYAENLLRESGAKEKIFQGFTNLGNRRYVPHTLENVVKILKKELRGGESFNYGVGSIRARYTPQFKSIAQIRKAKDRLMDKEAFEKVKKEIDDEFWGIVKALAPYSSRGESFGFGETVSGVMYDAARMGIPRALQEYNINEVPQDVMQDMAGFLEKLRTLPTEYFEAKILRDVDLAEFSGAVVPEGVNPDVIKALESRGIKDIRYYKRNDDADRAAKIGQFENLFFQTELSKQVSKDKARQQVEIQRGYIQFGPERKFNIALLEKANLSTFLHETGHFYLEVIGDLAEAPGASDQVKADYAAILKFLGVERRDQIEVKHHEKFARANEAYLMEGKAPSAELRSVFQKFKSWLNLIYRELRNLNVQLNDEVRGVFDRIYASDMEIEAAKADVDVSPLLIDAQSAGMTEAEFAAYRASVEQTTAAAKDALEAKLMREYLREQKAWWKEELAKVREEVAVDVDAMPVYMAFKALTEGKIGDTPIKLNKEGLVRKYGEDYVKRLPRTLQRVYTNKGGMDADAAAAYLGYNSGDELIEALVGMKPRNEYIEAEAQRVMRERHGDMLLDGTMAEEARIALHNTQRENVLMIELRALRKKQREVAPFVWAERQRQAEDRRQARAAADVPPASAFRDAARGLIGQTSVRNLNPYGYLLAGRKASREAFDAMAKGDYPAAATAKQRELLNHFLYLEASKARQEADSIMKYMRKFEGGTTRQQMGKAGWEYLDQIDALLDRYEFARISFKALDRRKNLALWVAEQEALGNEPAIDITLLDETRRANYREIPMDELRALRDAVKNIEHLARLKNKLKTKQAEVEFKQAIDELVASAKNNFDEKTLPIDQAAMTRLEQVKERTTRLDAMLIKMEQLVMWLDGNNVNGPWHTYLWNPIADAQVDEYDLTRQITMEVTKALEAMPKEQRLSMLDTFDIPGMGRVTRKFLISIAMNMGNAGNLDKMLRGYGWDIGTVRGALAKLNRYDIEFAQKMLDTINSLWPMIAELEKDMTGLAPPKVDPQPFEFFDEQGKSIGSVSGYYPLVYDPRKSTQGAQQETGNLGQLFEEGYVRATTPKGHTKMRTEGFAAPLLLDFEQVTTQHLAKVIKDLTHRRAIVAANKILTNQEIRNVLQETLGPAYERQLLPWLRSVVNDRNGGSTQGLTDFSRWMMSLRANVVAATMGFKATTVVVQFLGLSQSLDMVKGRYLGPALADFLRHPIALTREVRELSGEMRHRSDSLDRDIRDQLRNLTGQNSAWARAQRFAFHGIALADAVVSVPTWMGAYRQALAAGADQDTAVREADAAVRLTQSAGGQKDLAAIQRNNELAKALTMFYSYFSALYSRLRDMGRDVQEIRDMPRFLARVFWTVVIPATIAELMLGRGPDDDEDEALWAIRKVLLYPLMTVPIMRDVVSSIDSGFDYRFSPIAAGLEKIGKLAKSIPDATEDGEWGDVAANAAQTFGYVFGVAGTAQIAATGKYLWRVSEGEEQPDNLAELIYYASLGKRKED